MDDTTSFHLQEDVDYMEKMFSARPKAYIE